MSDTPTTLGEYRGRPIVGTALAVRKVGGGLDDPLAIDAEIVPVGGHRMLCIPVVCIDHQYPAEDRKKPDEGGVRLTHIFEGDGPVFFIDPTAVERARGEHQHKVMLAQKALDDEKERAAKAKKGTGEAPVDNGQVVLEVDAEAMVQAHLAGDHAKGLADGCPECEWEGQVEAREAELAAGDPA